MELQRAGLDNFTILERAHSLGGTWRENTYPGAGCDIPSPLYSWSYEPKSDWPKRFSGHADIRAYMEQVAAKHGLVERIQFGTEVTEAEFDAGSRTWSVRTAAGTTHTADVVVSAVGQLSRPALPNIRGLDDFQGAAFHSAQWNHDIDLRGKRVAAIGTGASAIQYLPEIQPQVAQLTLFQRTAAWVVPKPDVTYTRVHHALFKHVPPVRLAERFAIFALFETIGLGIADVPPLRGVITGLADFHRRRQVADPELRAKLTPDYPAGCKRALLSNNYFPALTKPNVHVETAAIEAVTETGVRTADGVLHEADVIIYGTGFMGTEFLWPMSFFGLGGHKLHDVWTDGAYAHLGIAVPEFPNLYLMYGPNTNLAAGSIIYMLESQARYIRQMVQAVADHPGTAFSVRPDVTAAWDEGVQARMDRTPWGFCTSWYRNAAGRITNNWPGTMSAYRWRTRTADLADYERV